MEVGPRRDKKRENESKNLNSLIRSLFKILNSLIRSLFIVLYNSMSLINEGLILHVFDSFNNYQLVC
jgi:predicted DNA repair protein MutK